MELLLQAEIAIAKIENSRIVTGELIRLGVAIGKGKRIKAVIESKKILNKVEVRLDDGTSYYFL